MIPRTVKINEMTPLINYLTADDILEHKNDPEYDLFVTMYDICLPICQLLNVAMPDIAWSLDIIRQISDNGDITLTTGISFTPDDVKNLTNNLIFISWHINDIRYVTGIIAHEVRHIWQHIYNPSINNVHAQGYQASLIHPAEIDADGFAIYYVAITYNLCLEDAANIVCLDEKTFNPEALSQRIKVAKKIQSEAKQKTNKKHPKRKLQDVLIRFTQQHKDKLPV